MSRKISVGIVEEREPWINAVRAAEWPAPGICSHRSAMDNGAILEIPAFRKQGAAG